MMKSTQNHILVAAVASFPLYWVMFTYLNRAGVSEADAVAVAATMIFLSLIYTGRYFVQIATVDLVTIPLKLFTILAGAVAIFTAWLFVFPNFRVLHHFPFINLLAYWLPFIGLGLSLGILIKAVRIYLTQLQSAKISAVNSESELKLLQSQISPHFLFNTLNNLYGISITNHQQIPPLLLKLSELLRYSVYDAKELFVPLKDEINYINNYIDFEKIRIGDRLVINSKVSSDIPDLEIAPMLLIIFVENAFKHAKNSTDDKIYVDIDLTTWSDSILFSVRNSYQSNEDSGIAGKYNGFGLENVKTRLNLLYPNKHDLKTGVNDGFFDVKLQLKTK